MQERRVDVDVDVRVDVVEQKKLQSLTHHFTMLSD